MIFDMFWQKKYVGIVTVAARWVGCCLNVDCCSLCQVKAGFFFILVALVVFSGEFHLCRSDHIFSTANFSQWRWPFSSLFYVEFSHYFGLMCFDTLLSTTSKCTVLEMVMCIHSMLICLFYVSKSNDRFLIFSQCPALQSLKLSCSEPLPHRTDWSVLCILNFLSLLRSHSYFYLFLNFTFFNGKHKKKWFIFGFIWIYGLRKKIEFTDLFFESLKFFTGNWMDSTEKKKELLNLSEKKSEIIDYCDGKKNENQILFELYKLSLTRKVDCIYWQSACGWINRSIGWVCTENSSRCLLVNC